MNWILLHFHFCQLSRRLRSPLRRFFPHQKVAPHEYGFGWHINRLRVGDRVFRASSARSNGGQIVMVIPTSTSSLVSAAQATGNSRNGTVGDSSWCRNTSSRHCHKRTTVIGKGQVAWWEVPCVNLIRYWR